MKLKDVKIGIGITASFDYFDSIKEVIKQLMNEGADVYPIFSGYAANNSLRYEEIEEFKKDIEVLTKSDIIDTINKVKIIKTKDLIDILLIIPCKDNNLTKLANGITDSPILCLAQEQIKNDKPVALGISTLDALGVEAKNLGILLNSKDIYFIPFCQNDPIKQPKSLKSNLEFVVPTIKAALKHKQIEPIVVE